MSHIPDVERLCKSYALEFKDCGNGHVQISNHGQLVNYWPDSKARTAHSPTLNKTVKHCSPWDAVKLCMEHAKVGVKKKAVSKGRAQFSLKPAKTNPAGLKHFYQDELPPWDESFTEFAFNTQSDAMRHEAYQIECQAMAMRADADELDEATA